MKNVINLTKFEIKRFWVLSRIIVFFAIFVVLCFVSILPKLLGMAENITTQLDFNTIFQSTLGFFVPVGVLLFSAGIISNDVKSMYLRTIITRPVLKYEYLSSKYLSTALNLVGVIIFYGIIPAILVTLFFPGSIKIDFLETIGIFILYTAEGMLFVSIAVLLSYFVKGFMNSFILALWIFLEVFVINGIIGNFFSYNKAIAIFSDFFFPAGFSDAAKLIGTGGLLFFESIFWGLAALSFFAGLTYYQITKIKVDLNSD